LQALGVEFVLQGEGTPRRVLVGKDLEKIEAVRKPTAWQLPELLIACDVENPLYGPDGAPAVFGPQKGATPEQVRMLDQWLRWFAEITGTVDLANAKGSGAAGGLGYGLCAMIPGTDARARMCREAGVRCAILAGSVEAAAERAMAEIGAVAVPIVDGPVSLEEAMRRTGELLERAAARVVRSA
jgi:glycerate kinase